MILNTARIYGFTAACALAIPAIALAQLPSYKTPGATTKVKTEQVCAADFGASAKPIAGWQRTEALERYGVRQDGFTGEIDHLIPVSLGGSNDPDNLWPFHGSGSYTFAAKQALAAKLHDLVCSGKMSLKDAQDAFRKDWTKSYQQHIGAMNAPGQ
jgi:hypothetical protein